MTKKLAYMGFMTTRQFRPLLSKHKISTVGKVFKMTLKMFSILACLPVDDKKNKTYFTLKSTNSN